MTEIVYGTKATAAYLARRAAHEAGGTAINFAAGTVILGDGNGGVPSLTDLLLAGGVTHEVWRGQVVRSVTVNSTNLSEIDILCVIPATDGDGHEIGPFWVREFAITDETGVVMLVGTTQVQKTTGADNGQTNDLSFIVGVGESNSSTVILTPPAAGFATQIDVYNIIEQMAPTAAEPIYRIDSTVNGKHYRQFAVRVAPQDTAKLGVGRPATDDEFDAGLPTVGGSTPFPWVIPQQVKRLLQGLEPDLLHSAVDSGTPNTYVLTLDRRPLKAAVRGDTIIFAPANASTGTVDCTLNPDALGAMPFKAADGATRIGKGHLAAGALAIAWYDGAVWRLVYSAAMNAQSTKWFVGTASGASPNALSITFSGPAPAARSAGVNIRAKIATGPNTGPLTINYGFGDIPVVLNVNGAALAGNETRLAFEAILFDDGTNLRLVNPALSSSNPHGGCALAMVNSGSIALSPRNGNAVIINGSSVLLPAAGVSAGLTGVYVNGVAGQNLAPSTTYYIGLAVISGVPTLRFWAKGTYGRGTDTTAGNIGIEVITNGGAFVSTDTLVGMAYIDAGGQFRDTDGARFLLSWFNRRSKKSVTTFTADRSTTSNTLTELHAEIRNYFINWSDELVHAEMFGSVWNSSGSYNSTGVALVSDLGIESSCPAPPFYTGGAPAPFWASVDSSHFSEGLPHYVTLFGVVQGNTGTWSSTDDYTYAGGGGYRSKVYINLTVKG